MGKGDRELPELVRAAETLESELVKLESLSRSVRKIRLNSERNISKAAKELTGAAELQEGLGVGLQALASAMASMQARQQAALEPLAAFANEIQARMQLLSEHMQAFAALGVAASEVTNTIQDANGDTSAIIDSVGSQLTQISQAARGLREAAHGNDFPEVEREADTLEQRVSALRKRLDKSH